MTKLRFYSMMFWVVLALFLASALGTILIERRVSQLEMLMYLQWQIDKDIIRHMEGAEPDSVSPPPPPASSDDFDMPGRHDPQDQKNKKEVRL